MKALHLKPVPVLLLLALGVIAIIPAATLGAGDKPGDAATGSNAVPLTVAIPQSVFDVTNGPVKDPFYPLTTRKVFPTAIVTNAAPATISPSEFVIKGFSGLPGQEVALINNCNLAAGERGVVITPVRRIGVKVISIKTSPVRVEILPDGQNQTIELYLPKGEM